MIKKPSLIKSIKDGFFIGSTMIKKVVPILIRRKAQTLEILAFRHPLAGMQLVKGSIEPNETYENAAIRELFEESGLIARDNPKFIGSLVLKSTQQDWFFYYCEIDQTAPDTWTYFCLDDGGLTFEFFWYSMHEEPSEDWHEIFKEALTFLRTFFDTHKK